MGVRRKSREILLQLLFQAELNSEKDPKRLLEGFAHFKKKTDAFRRAGALFLEISEKKEELDRLIEKYAEHWRLSRMSPIDRNILRAAIYELFYCDDIPTEVALDEAIEIAKSFGSEESGAFVNGILDKISKVPFSEKKCH